MKKALLIILCFSFFSTNAQVVKEKLVGNWTYHRFDSDNEIDSIGKKLMVRFFGKMSFNLTSDDNYQLSMMGKKEEGKWNVDENKIYFNSTKGNQTNFGILQRENDSLRLEMKPNEFIVFKRIEQINQNIDLKVDDIQTVSATNDQISKKWFITKKIVPNKSEKQIEMLAILLEGSYIDFKSNGEYEISILSIEETGKWDFNDKKDQIIQTREDETKVFWKIVKVSDNELLLNKGDLKEQYYFSTSEK